ncbi:MAG TPA: hypothetical protein VGN18_06265 [Jatrophihabitans sp.]|jgi:hypothetical protein|uniref:hypothetical protein n=1 Tax=Jatrophihabitans sp. TaxID=1932789 RepID=UPI002E06AAED|nr:hypothetical protein [Jatrophihabitans sp.]
MSTLTDPANVATAARRLYDAETALHAARQSGVDAWIGAAYDQLHTALLAYDTATRTTGRGPRIPHAA